MKVVLGFFELALAMKFLSTFDLVYQLDSFEKRDFYSHLDCDLYVTWFLLAGQIEFDGYEKNSKTSIGRFISSIVIFSFVVYLIPGLWGAPVKLVSGFLPPSFYKEWNQNLRASNHWE